jgi:hypothetical protein
MKKTLLNTGVIIAALILVLLFNLGVHYKRGSAMHVNLNVKDLPEHGLALIPSSDPLFSELTTSSRQAPDASMDALRPFSVLLKNVGNKTVVAYQLKWELTQPDGRTLTHSQGFTDLEKLKTINDIRLSRLTDKTVESGSDNIIYPGSILFCSPAGITDISRSAAGSNGNLIIFSRPPKTETGKGNRQVSQEHPETKLSRLAAQLSEASSITVTLDGALFDDGTFVGPDSTNFFSWITSRLNAKLDLLQEVQGLQRDKSANEAVAHLKMIADKPKTSINGKSTPDAIYNYYKKRYAQQMVMAQSTAGFREIEKEMAVLNNPHVKPRKL